MKQTLGNADVTVRLTFKQEKDAREAVRVFDQQVADGRTLGVRVVGGVNASLSGRLSMSVVDGSVDVLMDTDADSGSCVFLTPRRSGLDTCIPQQNALRRYHLS